MGLCVSYEPSANGPATARVVLPSGELREYSPPATAALALEEVAHQGWFLCDADRMGFAGSVAAMAAGEQLQPGQIYFVLPAEARKNGLRREDLAALAVRASAALVSKASANASGSAGRRRRAGSVSPLVFAQPPEVDGPLAYKTVQALAAKRRPVARAKSAGRMQPRFSPDLTAIPECE